MRRGVRFRLKINFIAEQWFFELDAFFRSNRIALEVQGAQHRLHNTSSYKDVKKLEDIVNRDRKKRCMFQDHGMFLLEILYEEDREKVIPERIQKIKVLLIKRLKFLTYNLLIIYNLIFKSRESV